MVRIAVGAPFRSLVDFHGALAEFDIPLVVTDVLIRGMPMNMKRGPDATEALHAEDVSAEGTLNVMSFRYRKGSGT